MRRINRLGQFGLPAIALAIGTLATSANAAGPSSPNGVYIVEMAAPPVVENVTTKPAQGQKIDPTSPAVVNYLNQLTASQNAAAAQVGATKVQSYGYVFNGMAVKMSSAQAEQMAKVAGVVRVVADEKHQLDTSSTVNFLGLSGANGFWNSTGFKGENIIIGIVDGGITPDHPSFAGAGFGAPPAKWKGGCTVVAGAGGWGANDCNNKLIGARFYNSGFGGNAGVLAVLPYEFNSPRDYDGHGTHTASTSGGNENVVIPPTSQASAYGAINGIAPRARIAAYKVCYGIGGTPNAGCFNSDSMAAIDQAIADGVDVINFSISGTQSNFNDPVEQAFRRAASAGVFVAASAGNSGPTTFTVAHPSPWITTVAATTHDRLLQGTLTTGGGTVYTGASAARTAVPAGTAMILASDAVRAGRTVNDANLCYSSKDTGGNALDPVKVAGKIVVCDRGTTDRVNKSLAVMEAGGVGMVLTNTSANTLNPDFHSVPTVHLSHLDRAAVRSYVGSPVATGTGAISKGAATSGNPAPNIASFSSRGPIPAANNNIMKPDIAAPGQDIMAGVAPPGNNGEYFGLLSGTSMSSPHIAGIAALFKQARPTWSPMAIKSALMTSSSDILDGPPENIFQIISQGAGFVQPKNALNPGLVFDSGPTDWTGFMCGLGASSDPLCSLYTMDPSDLNLASIAAAVPTSKTVKRRVTNVSGNPATFTSSVVYGTTPPGYTITVNPSTLTLAAGATGQFSVTITRTSAALGSFTGALIKWTGAGTTVKMPVQLLAVNASADAPTQVSGTGGLMKYKVNVGYTGAFSASPRGLVPAQVNSGNATTGSSQTFSVVVPPNSTYARFSLFAKDVTVGSDIDIVVRNPGGAVVGTGFNGAGADEEVNLVNPAAGTYTVEVQGFFVAAPGTTPFKVHSWVLGNTAANNFAVYAPTTVTTGQQVDISIVPVTFMLTYGTKYLGSVVYGGGASSLAPTIVRIDR